MGLYDNFALPTSDRYISTYAGVPLQEVAALGDTLQKNYMKGVEGASAFNVMRDNVKVTGADSEFKNQLFGSASDKIKEYAERGDYENALPAIMQASSLVSGNEDLAKAKSAYKASTDHALVLQKAYQKGDITDEQYKHATDKMEEYQGVSAGDSMSKYLYTPAKAVDILGKLIQAGGKVKPHERDVFERDSITGNIVRKTISEVDQNELLSAISAAVASDPAISAYYKNLIDIRGPEAAQEYLNGEIEKAFNTVYDGNKTKSRQIYQDTGVNNGGGSPGSADPAAGYEHAPTTTREGVDYFERGKDLDFMDDPDSGNPLGVLGVALSPFNPLLALMGPIKSLFSEDTPIAEREDSVPLADMLLNIDDKIAGPIAHVVGSVLKMFSGQPDETDKQVYLKFEDAVKEAGNISNEDWDKNTPYEQEQIVKQFIEQEGEARLPSKINTFDITEEVNRNVIKENDNEGTITKKVTDDVLKLIDSKKIYSLGGQELTSLENDSFLSSAIAEGRVKVIGEYDARSPYGTIDSTLSNAYVLQAMDEDGDIQKYLIPKSPKQRADPSPHMVGPPGKENLYKGVSNEMFDTTVAEVYSAFPIRGYSEDYTHPQSGTSIKGKRASNGDKTITIEEISSGGETFSDADMKKLAEALSRFGVTYDEASGEIRGINEYTLSNFLYTTAFK